MKKRYIPYTVGKTLPHSEEAEKGLLGSMILAAKDVIPVAAAKASEDSFYVPANKTMFTTMVEMWQNGEPIELLSVTQKLRDKLLLDSIGGAAAVTNIFNFVPSATNYEYYLETVLEKHLLRQVIDTASEVVRSAYEEQDEVNTLVASTQEKFRQIGNKEVKTRQTFKEALLAKLDRMENNEPDADILKTGLEGLDRYSPLRRGDMPLIVGERKDGKSILALTLMSNMVGIGERGLYFSLESPKSEIIDRLFAGQSRIPQGFHHVKRMNQLDLDRASRTITKLSDWKIEVYDDIYDLMQIVGEIRQQKAKNPDLSVVAVDYAQLVRPPASKSANREQEIATISRTLRLISIEEKVALLLISQLNENRRSRESRALENDATACWEIEMGDLPNERSLNIPWQRMGESGVGFKVAFLGSLARVENLSHAKEDQD